MEFKSRISGRTVFVTGANGFIGSHLVELGADVHVFVRATSSGELNNIRHRSNEITIHRGNLRDKHSVDQAPSALEGIATRLYFILPHKLTSVNRGSDRTKLSIPASREH
jgi:dTDP-glucose 4,6-dehydratase